MIGSNIRRYRKELKLTQQEMADKVEISNDFLSRVEKGTEYPSIRLLERMAELMDKQLLEFFIHRNT